MLLELRDVETSYGPSQVLFGVSLSLGEGEAITLLGRNGMGKTTTVRSITGLQAPKAGEIRFAGTRVDRLDAHKLARMGIGLVPEGRQIFPNLSVRENLLMASANRRGDANPWTLERVVAFFPRLGERLANGGNQLSGGEQQMLAIGRALMTNPLLLILDEATEGLAPLVRAEIWDRLRRLRVDGMAMIIIDKEVETLADLASRHFILEKGEVVWSGDSAGLTRDSEVLQRYLSV